MAEPAVTAAEIFYRSLGVPSALDLQAVYSLPAGRAGHALIVVADGSACDVNGPPFIDALDL